MKKRGQFFILAVVIISAVLVSLVAIHNYASTTPQPERFYDLSQEIKQESAKVIDYGVYSDPLEVSKRIEEFSEVSAKNLLNKYPDLGFVFIYGDAEELIIENYDDAESSFQIGSNTEVISGGSTETESDIEVIMGSASFSEEITQLLSEFQENSWNAKIINPGKSNIKVKINQQEYDFNVEENQQFFMVLLKNQGTEEYVDLA